MLPKEITLNLPFQDSLNTTNASSICQDEDTCQKPAFFPCHHCPRNLCLEHLNKHNTLNMLTVKSLLNELDEFVQLLSNFDTQISFEKARDRLDSWKSRMLEDIENIYNLRLNDINCIELQVKYRTNTLKEYMESKLTNINTQLSEIKKLNEVSKQRLLEIENNMNQLRQLFESIQCNVYIDTNNISLNDSINVYNLFSYKGTVEHNSLIKPYQTIPVKNIKKFISSQKGESILWLNIQDELHYIDKKFSNVLLEIPQTLLTSSIMLSDQQIRMHNLHIVDMKWCSFAQVFLILFPRFLLSLDHKTNQFTQISITRYKNYPLRCITCLNNTSIYISYSTSGTCIELWKYACNKNHEISINEFFKRWDNLTDDKNEWILNMNTNSNFNIGLLISKAVSIYRRFELRDENLHLLKIVQLDNDYVENFFPFQYNYWFIKSLSGKYYVYSAETHAYSLSSFDFPLGLETFGINSIVKTTNQEELVFCDILPFHS